MPKYKLANGTIVDTTDYSESQLIYFKYKNPDATVVEDFQNGAVETDASAVPDQNQVSTNGVLNSEDTSLESPKIQTEESVRLDKARVALNDIVIPKETRVEIEERANTPIRVVERAWEYNPKLDKMMQTGEVISETFQPTYANFIDVAKKQLAESSNNEYDMYNVPEEQWSKRAKELYIQQEEEKVLRVKAEEILEEYEKDVFGSWFSLRRIKKGLNSSLAKTDEELEYIAGRAVLTTEFKEQKKQAVENYKNSIDTINTFSGVLETTGAEIDSLNNKFTNNAASITQQDVDRYNDLVNTQKTAYGVYSKAFDDLNAMEGSTDKLDVLADMSIRTYNNTEVATNRITGAVARTVAGLGSVLHELSPTQIIRRTSGVDQGTYVPVYLGGVAGVGDVFGSLQFKMGVDNIYKEVEKIENVTKAKQQLGEVKDIEDFGEFMLDLFSEQAVNTAITVGTGGAGLIAVSAAAGGNKFHEMQVEMEHDPDLKISALEFYGGGILYGAAEYITERVSLGQAKGALKYFGFGKNNFKKAAKGTFEIADDYALKPFSFPRAGLKYGINVNKEGGAEFAAQLLNNATDKYLLDKDIALTDGLGEAYLTGAIMSGLGFQAPVLAGDIYRAFNGDGEIAKITNRTERLFEIRKQMNTITANMPKEGDAQAESTLNMLQQEADNLIIENLKSKKLAENRIDELSDNDKRLLLDIDAETYKYKKGIEAANSNPNLSAAQKLNFINKFQYKIDAANAIKNAVIANSTNSAAKAKQKKIQIKLAAEKDLMFNTVNVQTQEDALKYGTKIIDESNLEPDKKKALKEQLQEAVDAGDVNGYYIGAELGLPMAFTIENNLVEAGLGATVLHETGHATLFKKLVEGNADIVGLTNNFESYMVKNFKGAKEKFAEVEKKYPADKFSPAEIAEEKLATMLEYTYNVDMSADRTFSKKVVDQFRKIVPGKESEGIQTGQDVFKALQSFSRSFDSGEITGLANKILKGNIKVAQKVAKEETKKEAKTKFSLASAQDNLGKIPQESLKGVKAQTDIAMELPGMVKAQVAKRFNLKPQQLDGFTDAVVEKMYLGQETTKWDGRGQLYGFLNGRIALRIKDVVREEYNKPQQERMYLSSIDNLQAEDQKGIAQEEAVDTPVKTSDRKQYRNLVDSKALPVEATNIVKDKILSTVRVLKSRLDTKVSKNKTVTPLVAEIKKQMGKQADIEFKKALGVKKGGELRRNFLKLKKPILENMTTTWLMQSMPFAVQKQVNGSFTTNWQGKKIDRETVGTDKAGRTSGAEIVRRVPNAINNVSDADFLGYLFKDGEVIRGRKEAVSKALAEEYSFDLFTQELQNPDSPIAAAFEANQERLGVELFDNYVAEVARQVERGNVKFSKNIQEKSYQKAAGRLFREAQSKGIDEVIDENGNILLNTKDYEKFDDIGILVRSAFDDGLVTDAPIVAFLQGIKKSDVVPDFVKIEAGKALTRKTSSKAQLDKFANNMVTLGKTLGSTITDVIGFDGFGFYNRLLDSAKSKKDKLTNKTIPGETGPYYNTLSNLQSEQKPSKNLPVNLDISKVSPMNSKIGVMGKIGKLLNSDKTAEQKIEEYKKYIPEITEANQQNKILAKHIIKTAINLVNQGKITPASYVQMLQAQTNAVKGLRSLTGLKYITFKDGPQGNIKGEHLADNAGSMLEFAELAFENLSEIELDYKIDQILEFHDQWLETRETLDFVDAFGKNNPFKDKRILLLPKADQTFVYTYDLRPASELIEERSEAIKFSKNIDIKEFSKVVTGQKAINNANKKDYAVNPKGISVWDFDDTLATTKSNVLYTMPNVEGGFSEGTTKLKAIFMVGGPGAGKTNVGKGLQLGRRGYKVVNQDIALEAMKTEVGLPANESDYTAEQRSMRSKLGSDARKAAVAKFDKYAANGDGMVIDGTGASYNATTKKIKALEDQGFEVHMVVATTPLETALERNRARKERSLKDFIVEKTYDQVQTSLAQYRKDFGDRLYEINTETIEYGKPLPKDFLDQVYAGITKNKVGKIDATEFAAESSNLEARGAEFDFREFSQVKDGDKGPMFEKAMARNKKFGNENVFILTARPADAKFAIHKFLKGIGLNVRLENITGLADGTPKAKADWMINKVAEGYNDFYFSDDAIKNVKAVQNVLDNFDVKGKVQQAKIKFSKNLNKEFNNMIERQTGVESVKDFSKVVARRRGKKKGRFKFFIPPSAEDFRGLTQYTFAGKGKQGEADQRFFEEALMDPYFKGIAAMERDRQTVKNDTKALLKEFKSVKKRLSKLTPDGDYTFDAAIRVYLWDQAGFEIPGISKRDRAKLSAMVANDPALKGFADGLLLISKKDQWTEPGEYWDAQTTLSDLNSLTEKKNRKEYLEEFINNADEIFDEKSLNKIEALYGRSSRDAIEDALYAMKTGSNRTQGSNKITNAWNNWVNNSVGTIMFFNRRSAILQTLSSANFINWSDNNPVKAAIAFANQPQYWKDFAMIFNSDKLKQRRSGLKSDVQESEIANAAKDSKDKVNAVVSYLLKIGFTPTQIADSFAIAAGGATLYRNRVNTYLKEGMSKADAETKAFADFSKLSDEAQQSGDPALVSQQQRSTAGRLILAFQNTPMQYTRLMKKSAQDLINGRGDAKTHVSKILYYGAVQNFIFNALQNALFALIPGFDEDEEDDEKASAIQEKKATRILNGMVDSVLRGTGMYGAVVSTIKNTIMKFKEQDKKGFKADHAYTIIEAANISPPIGSKLRKIYSGIQTSRFDKDVIKKHPWDVTIDGEFNLSPSYSIVGNIASATLNIPLDRAIMEAQGIAEALDARNTKLQRVALALGWRTWDVGAKNEEFDLIKAVAALERKEQGKVKAKKTREENKEKERQRVANMTEAEYNAYMDAKIEKRRASARKAAETRRQNRK